MFDSAGEGSGEKEVGVDDDRGSSAAGTETKAPNSESADPGIPEYMEWRWAGAAELARVTDTGSKVGDARGVAGENKVANLSISASFWA